MTPKDQVPRTDSSSIPSSSNAGEDEEPSPTKQQEPLSLPPTDMLYMTYEGNWWTECDAAVLDVKQDDDNKVCITLDRTVMHAQGGGQPTDKGILQVGVGEDDQAAAVAAAVVQVEKVTMDRATGICTHAGKWATTPPPTCVEVGTPVRVQVDKDTRQILSECHTAGHVCDSVSCLFACLLAFPFV